MTRAPTTLHEHFRADPRGADSFKNWIDDRIWELLQRPAELQEYPGGCTFFGPPLRFATLHQALADMRIRVTAPNQRRVRVRLLDGTIIREWAAAWEATTGQSSKAADRVGGQEASR